MHNAMINSYYNRATNFPKSIVTNKVTMVTTLQRKYPLCIPFLGIVRPHSQFLHSCICEQFLYSQDLSTYFPAAE
jgi:hypothetical protein